MFGVRYKPRVVVSLQTMTFAAPDEAVGEVAERARKTCDVAELKDSPYETQLQGTVVVRAIDTLKQVVP